MLNEILFVLAVFATRVVLPILFTLFLGSLIERALNRKARLAS